jgi:hypothetical protein
MLKEFPLYLNIKDKAIDENYFKNINKIRLLSLIRNEIHNLIVGRKDENDCFDLDFIGESGFNRHLFKNK